MKRTGIAVLMLLMMSISACRLWVPEAQGLVTQQWVAQQYARQDQVEVQWKQHSFSFLLYQQQQGQILELLALSLTGQQLFRLTFDGQRVTVVQRIDQMKLLPFDFVVRDILFASYPGFAELQRAQVGVQQETADQQVILIQQQPVLNIQRQPQLIVLDNLQVPYQMVFTSVQNTLKNDHDNDQHGNNDNNHNSRHNNSREQQHD
ncbi:DUF3261 domain-containing protein [Acinetobacter sp. WZC-1]|uniref:DUF3261 domain-containing protein n=1 Tax=Acinetobacter sp. WZC-1 TaxID=3459034 RepID=UPI00403DFB10